MFAKRKDKSIHNATVAENTWFERCFISAAGFASTTYSLALNLFMEQTIRESSIFQSQEVSRDTVFDRFSSGREAFLFAIDQQFQDKGQIVDVDKKFLIDEYRISRRKNGKGPVVCSRIMNLENDATRVCIYNYRLEICPDDKSDGKNLIALIKRHVAVGTSIQTDYRKGYMNFILSTLSSAGSYTSKYIFAQF